MHCLTKLALLREHMAGRLCRRASMRSIFMVFLAVGCSQPARATLSCGPQPTRLPVDVTTQIKEQAEVILQAPPKTVLRALVTARRRELRHKNAEVDPSALDQNLLWVVCQTISNDQTLPTDRQFDKYSGVYRLLSETMTQAAGPAE